MMETMGELYQDALQVITAWPSDDPARQRFLDLLAEGPDAMWAGHPVAHITSSALIVHPDLERVLLCLHGRANKWMQVGGHCEPGDSTLAGAALREALEESGLTGLRSHPAPVDLDIHEVNCRHGGQFHFDVRFALLAAGSIEEQVSEESHALGWFTADALPSPLAHATERLIPLALKAFR